jgi:ribosome biogenesis protein Nip4
MLDAFVRQFIDQNIEHVRIGNAFFSASDELLSLQKRIPYEPFAVGIFLGEAKGKQFFPSSALIDLVAHLSSRKVFVDDKAEWLFLCGRDMFGTSVTRANVQEGHVLVQNQHDENLGYGKFSGGKIRHMLDKGEYLRMER